jgi:hypothetical protein
MRPAHRGVCVVVVSAAFLVGAPGAFAATTIGANMSGTPMQAQACGPVTMAPSCDALPLSELGASVAAPSDGVVVRWRVKGASGPMALRVVQPFGGGYLFVSSGAPQIPADTGLDTFVARQPIKAGDFVGIELSSATATFGLDPSPMAPSGTSAAIFDGPIVDGTVASPAATVNQARIYVNADVEPDADHDGFGDETQDQCPSDASTAGACPPPPAKDTTPPVVSASIAKTLRLSKQGAISFLLTTKEAASGSATGTISVPKASKVVRFKTTKLKLTVGKLTRVKLKLSKGGLKAVRKALKHHQLKAKLRVTVKDAAANATVLKRTVKLKR